jgi:ELWxxDGT repeat protein
MRSILAASFLALALSAQAQTPYLVKDLNTSGSSSPGSSTPAGFTLFGLRVYFAATTTADGRVLWSTDGTPSGTALFSKDASSPSQFFVLNGKLIFSARDVAHGREMWVTEGTPSGTHLLADIAPGTRK